MTSWLLTLPGFQTNAFLVMEINSFSYILIFSHSVSFCHWSIYKVVLSLCFHEINTNKLSAISLSHDSSQMHQASSMSWGSFVLVLCSVACSLKSPRNETLHRLQTACLSWPELLGALDTEQLHSQTEVSCWVIWDAKPLLKGPQFMKWRNSILWQCTSKGSVLLRLPTDSSCEHRIRPCFHTQGREISICFHLTSVSDCGMHFLRPCIWSSGLWHFSFWIHWWQTPGSRAPQLFSLCEIPFSVWYFGLESRQKSQWLQWEFVLRAWGPSFWDIASHAGQTQRHKPQFQNGIF